MLFLFKVGERLLEEKKSTTITITFNLLVGR